MLRNKEVNERTEEVLKCISLHLSSRPSLRRCEYLCKIVNTYICLEPSEIEVFPDRYHKRAGDKMNVLYHVLHDHYPDCLPENLADGKHDKCIHIKRGVLTPGCYIYKLSFTGNRRQWIRSL